MTTLNSDHLEFARAHIEKYYDSDFFPKPPDFDALWANWEEVKSDLSSRNIQKLSISTPWVMAAPKPGSTYRVVHQLDPLDCIVYTALVSSICEKVEAARPPIEENIACSYRIVRANGSFFASGTGWPEFTEKTEELAEAYEWVLSVDISDFYNQIYLHRLSNAIEYADPSLSAVAFDIEYFITSMNSKVSQGIPVGPAASIVLAEAVLLDVDLFIKESGLKHTRYVDDFRIFANDRSELEKLLERLTIYLYENHRLSVATEKTLIAESSAYVADRLHNDKAEEREDILDTLDEFNPYSMDWGLVETVEDDSQEGMFEDEYEQPVSDATLVGSVPWSTAEPVVAPLNQLVPALLAAMETVKDSEFLDLGVSRVIIRTARRESVKEVARPLLERLCFFSPVASDTFVYIDSVTDDKFASEHKDLFLAAIKSACINVDYVRYWLTWYLARHLPKFNSQPIRDFVYSTQWIELACLGAVAEVNIAWVRNLKNRISDHSPRHRRAIIFASQILPADERGAWLKNVINNAASKFDVWMARWILNR